MNHDMQRMDMSNISRKFSDFFGLTPAHDSDFEDDGYEPAQARRWKGWRDRTRAAGRGESARP